MMKSFVLAIVLLVPPIVGLAKDHSPLSYIAVGQVNPGAILAPPPLLGSPEQAADMDEVHT